MNQLLSLEKSTSNAIPFEEWETKPVVFYEEVIVKVENDNPEENNIIL